MNLASLGHVSLDGSKFKADSSKHKTMSYGRLKEKEQKLCEEIEALTRQATACDTEEDADYGEKTGDELADELKFKEQRLEKIKDAKEALEAREKALNPGKPIDDKKQISFADTDAVLLMTLLSSFVFAAPFSPTRAITSPAWRVIFTSDNAGLFEPG